MNLRRRRGLLLGLAIALVAIAVTGWLALTGRVDWLARFAEPRIERALLAAGVETDSLDIQRLSVGGGRVEHASFRFNGGTAEVHGLEVALGFGNIAARRAGAVSIDRLELWFAESTGDSTDLVLPRLENLPFESIEVREWRAAFPAGSVVPQVTGSLRAGSGADDIVNIEGDFASDEAKGSFSGEYDGRSPRFTLRVSDAILAPDSLLAIFKAMPDASAPAGLTFGWESAAANAEISLGNNAPVAVTADVKLTKATATRGEQAGELGSTAITISWKRGGPVALELEAAGVAFHSGEMRFAADTLQFIGSEEGGSVSLGSAVFSSGGREVRGHGLGSFAAGAGMSGEGTWILESAMFDGFSAGEAEILLKWQDSVLSAATDQMAISGRVKADVERLELTVTGLGGTTPGLNGRVLATVDLAPLFPEGTRLLPARERLNAKFLGLLASGSESLRVEYDLASAVRTVESAGFGGGFTGALAGVVTLDSSHLSASVAGELRNISLNIPDQGVASFPEANLKWSTGRVWIDAIRGWPKLEAQRALRELLWISNIDLRVTDGGVDLADLGSATGVSATLVSNGVDISERAGGSLVLSAETLRAADREFAGLGGTLAFGLDGGTLVADVALASPRIPVKTRQAVEWSEAFSMSGSYETGPVDLAAARPLDGLLPELSGITVRGTASAAGPLRLGPNGFEAGARIEFDDAGVEWPDEKVRLDGVTGLLDLDSVRPLHGRDGQRLTIASAKIQDLEFTEGVVEFGIADTGSVSVSRLEARTLGGAISAAPFTFDAADPKPATEFRIRGLRIEQVLGFFPDVPASAEGGIVGVIPVSWDGSEVAFGTGYIELQPGELGRVTFDYDIRMLSAGREDQEMFYPVLRRVEKAIRDLHFDRLRIDLYPTATPGRSMQIRLAGVTTTQDIHAPVELEINVNAPLDRFVKWGTNPVKP